jgi:ribosomal RNA-processing protein 12
MCAPALTSSLASRKSRRKPGQDAEKFNVDEETGKMVIDSDDSGGSEDEEAEEDVVGTAYREKLTSVDGFTQTRTGRVKFNKDTKKRRRENAELEDIEMGDATVDKAAAKKVKRKKSVAKVGQEFRAKVSTTTTCRRAGMYSLLIIQHAGGDVKKGGVDPYAYLTLSQAAKGGKGKGQQKFTVTGKR